jgi:hypothetical protein
MGQPSEGLPLRSDTTVLKKVAHHTEGDKSKNYIPPPPSKLGLIKIFVKAMDKESEGLVVLSQQSPPPSKKSKAKMKE